MKLNSLNTNKHHGFKTPDRYFDNLDQDLLHLAKLHAKTDASGFKAPNDYFNTLETQILQKTSQQTNPSKVITLKRNTWLYVSSIAATLLLLFSLTLFNKSASSFDSLNNDTLVSYILSQDIDYSEMASLIKDETTFADNILKESISDQNIETYLENDLELDDLLNQN